MNTGGRYDDLGHPPPEGPGNTHHAARTCTPHTESLGHHPNTKVIYVFKVKIMEEVLFAYICEFDQIKSIHKNMVLQHMYLSTNPSPPIYIL